MSADAMQSSRQYRPVPTTSAYAAPLDLHYDKTELDAQGYYTGQNASLPYLSTLHSKHKLTLSRSITPTSPRTQPRDIPLRTIDCLLPPLPTMPSRPFPITIAHNQTHLISMMVLLFHLLESHHSNKTLHEHLQPRPPLH